MEIRELEKAVKEIKESAGYFSKIKDWVNGIDTISKTYKDIKENILELSKKESAIEIEQKKQTENIMKQFQLVEARTGEIQAGVEKVGAEIKKVEAEIEKVETEFKMEVLKVKQRQILAISITGIVILIQIIMLLRLF